MNAYQTLTVAPGTKPVATGVHNMITGTQTIKTDSLAPGPEISIPGMRRDRPDGGDARGLKARWGKRFAALVVGFATMVTMQVVSAASSSAYVYTKGTSSLVYVDSVTPIYVTPPSSFTQYPHKTLRNITPPSLRVWRNGVASNLAQGVLVQHKLWRYNASGWAQSETLNTGGVISAGYNSVYVTSSQFYLQQPSAYYFIESTVTLLGSNGVWLFTASIRPNRVNDFSCSAACVRYNDYVYIS